MRIPFKAKMHVLLFCILAVGLVCACTSSAPPTTAPPSQPAAMTGATSEKPPTSPDVPGASNMVKVVYFHPHIRCGPCIYVEVRTRENIETYFQSEVDSGRLTYEVYDLGDKANAGIANKYKVVGSQLFINVVKSGVDQIKHIGDVWMPKYLNDQDAFDELIQKTIRQALKDAS
ncbi:MAG: hypothetical protein FJ022_05590 [Chloroflexi bacterium]|nr:hypothetical protein [Chloroflexota bacterium]MBM4450261.1 hypothetical protein [Chloroflexota bacterium]